MNTMNNTFDMLDTNNHEQDDTFQLLAILWTNKWWIILSALLCGSLGLAYGLSRTPQFQAEALVLLEKSSNGVQLSQDIAEMLSPESEAVTEIEILKSRLVLGKVVEELSLDVIASPIQLPFVGNFLSRNAFPRPQWEVLEGFAWHNENIVVDQLQVSESWLGLNLPIVKLDATQYQITRPDGVTLDGVIGRSLEDHDSEFSILISELQGSNGARFVAKRITPIAAVNRVRSKLSVSEKSRNAGILRIAMVTADPTLSESIVAAVVNAYVNQNIDRSAEEAERSLAFMNDQLPIIQSQLREAEADLNEYRLQSESIDLNYEAQSILERSVSLDSQLSGLSLEETELSRRFTQNHPTYRALIDKKQRLLDEKLLLSASIKTLPATQQEILRKTRDVDVSQQIYIQLLNKSQELSVMKAGAVGNVRLIDDAAANPIPVEPKVPLIVALACMLGAALAAGLIFLRNNMSKAIDSPDDLAKLNIPTFAVIPFSRYQSKTARQHEFALLAREHSSELAVEAVRSLRTSLHFSLQDRERNIVCVTGPSPTVGKSFVSTNLAYLAAQSGAKVLVIDGDMRRGNLGRYYNVPKDLPGLAQMLEGSCAPSEVMHEVDLNTFELVKKAAATRLQQKKCASQESLVADIEYNLGDDDEAPSIKHTAKPSAVATITVVPRGQTPDNPSELLMHNRFPEFLERASQDFDIVIVDTPPVLAATDAVIIGKYSDARLMVVRQGETTTHEAEEVQRTFTNNKSRITGIVLNGYDAQGGRYGKYGTQYGYRYNY